MLIENNGVKYYSSPEISNIKPASGGSISHGFFTRNGGVSKPPFDELNIDPYGGDDPMLVSQNLQKISETIGFNLSRLVNIKQVHGDHIYKVEAGMSAKNMEADAVMTNQEDIAISIKTADCVPILMVDPANNAIAAVHAGWKSTIKNIVSKTVSAMGDHYGTRPGDLIAAIGPHINSCCFQVSGEVKGEFQKAFPGSIGIIENNNINLGQANINQLIDSGLIESNITTIGGCTSCNSEEFFSHRRDGADGATGRELSLIMIKGA